MCFIRRTIAYLCLYMICFDAVDFSERRSEEVISFFWRSVYYFWQYCYTENTCSSKFRITGLNYVRLWTTVAFSQKKLIKAFLWKSTNRKSAKTPYVSTPGQFWDKNVLHSTKDCYCMGKAVLAVTVKLTNKVGLTSNTDLSCHLLQRCLQRILMLSGKLEEKKDNMIGELWLLHCRMCQICHVSLSLQVFIFSVIKFQNHIWYSVHACIHIIQMY